MERGGNNSYDHNFLFDEVINIQQTSKEDFITSKPYIFIYILTSLMATIDGIY